MALLDQLRELVQVARERGMHEAANYLEALSARTVVIDPTTGGSVFDPVDELFFRHLRERG